MDSLCGIQWRPEDFIMVSLDLNFHAPAAHDSTRAATNSDAARHVLSAQRARISEEIVGVQADETTRKTIDQALPVTQ